MMEVTRCALPGVMLLALPNYGDERGFFSETYSRRRFAESGISVEFVQDNHSLSRKKGTLRGLHFQIPPFAQDKLVRVVRGSILDVVVDLRHGSPAYGRHEAVMLSADEWKQLFVPIGFAHGFCTLEPNTEVMYKVSNYYSPAHDKGVRWNDPALRIDWPVSDDGAIVSAKDQAQPLLAMLPRYFAYSPPPTSL